MSNFLIKEIDFVTIYPVEKKIDLNIAITMDENYITPSGVLIYSILQHNRDLNIHFHIFTTCKNMNNFIKFKEFETNITIYILDESYFSELQTPGHFSSAIYYRIAIPSILNLKLKNILYIDADVLCVGSLKEFTRLDISKYYIAAIQDLGMNEKYLTSIGVNDKYFNSGVMYLNIEKWVRDDIFKKLIYLVNQRDFSCPDQDALNILFNNNVLYISNEFNYFKEKNSEGSKLIHYIGWIKPWSMAADNNDIYLKYYNLSPFKEIPLTEPNTYKLARILAKKYRKNKRYGDYIKWYCLYLVMKIKHKMK